MKTSLPRFAYKALACSALTLALPGGPAAAQDSGWEVGAVLDVGLSSRALDSGSRSRGLRLGHSDVVARGPLGSGLRAEVGVAAHDDEGKLEAHLENLWVETTRLPGGLQLRAGRFASQIGYRNELHPHADDFTERPLLYRGFLGGHWIDDGARINWTAPTPFYLGLGVEAFRGRALIPEAASSASPGATTFTFKTGADLGANQSWQWGVSYLQLRRPAEVEEHIAGQVHTHAHGGRFSGKRTWMTDLVWKWAPDGDPQRQQVRVIWEAAIVAGIHPMSEGRRHRGNSLAAVWRFHPAWEVGVRTDRLSVHHPELHDDGTGTVELEFAAGRLRENAIMLAYKPNHQQAYRVQIARQKVSGAEGMDVFPRPATTSIQFQMVWSFGAHGAHSF